LGISQTVGIMTAVALGAVGGAVAPVGSDWLGLIVAGSLGLILRVGVLLQNRRFKERDKAVGDLIVTTCGGVFAVIVYRHVPSLNGVSIPQASEIEWAVSMLACYVGAELVFGKAWKKIDDSEVKQNA
jgi:glycopeptide antibiotics resistance protein